MSNSDARTKLGEASPYLAGARRGSFQSKMVERYKGFQVLLIIAVSFWLFVFPAYHHFSILDESDLTSCDPCIKNMDQDDSIVTAENGKI